MKDRSQSPDYNIALELEEAAAPRTAKAALVMARDGSYRSWTFGELRENAVSYGAALMEAGVRQGQRVMLMVRPSMEFVCLTFALFRLGATVILIDPGMGYRNLLRCVGGVRPDALVAIPLVHLLSRIFPAPFRTVRIRVCVGRPFAGSGRSLRKLAARAAGKETTCFAADSDDPAAIIFTTGSTGPPKGVSYTHGIFHAQLRLIREYYRIGPGEVDQPCFPLFALFSTALGARAVIPEMNPAKPARVNPRLFVRSILDQGVTYSFGSPAIWDVVSRYCLEHGIILPVRTILMAGAPVSGALVERVSGIMAAGGVIHTPYGATECLPVASISGKEILAETWPLTRLGQGVCVGRSLPGMEVRIIRPDDGPIRSWGEVRELPPGETGEIVVRGPVVTAAYDHNDRENLMAKIPDGDGFWHRMGDLGYLDDAGRLWFCGRKAHRVRTEQGVMYTIPCEAIFNEHPAVRRSALVGVGREGRQRPVLIVELADGRKRTDQLLAELRAMAGAHALTQPIETFLVHPSFPVDIRHNAKIFRERLALWADDQLQEQG